MMILALPPKGRMIVLLGVAQPTIRNGEDSRGEERHPMKFNP